MKSGGASSQPSTQQQLELETRPNLDKKNESEHLRTKATGATTLYRRMNCRRKEESCEGKELGGGGSDPWRVKRKTARGGTLAEEHGRANPSTTSARAKPGRRRLRTKTQVKRNPAARLREEPRKKQTLVRKIGTRRRASTKNRTRRRLMREKKTGTSDAQMGAIGSGGNRENGGANGMRTRNDSGGALRERAVRKSAARDPRPAAARLLRAEKEHGCHSNPSPALTEPIDGPGLNAG
jgi:hypothetical protein